MGVGWRVWVAGLLVFGCLAPAFGGEGVTELSRLRAALAGLTYCPPETTVVVSEVPLERWKPAGVPASVRRRLGQLSLSVVSEGGYQPTLTEKLFFGTVDAARRARERLPLRQLDHAIGDRNPAAFPNPDPREWQPMAPGADGGEVRTAVRVMDASSGLLLYLMPLAVAYAEYPDAGGAAAVHLAELVEDDYRAAACARAAFAWLSGALAGKGRDRDALLRSAAAAAGDGEVASALLGARVKDWRNLRDEATLLGRLERCVSIWYRSRDGRGMLVSAGKELSGWEARGFAALLAGATYGMEEFPPEAVAAMLRNRPLDELAFDLRELATGGAVLSLLPVSGGTEAGER